MSSNVFLASAPGSVFLLGEHAVLHQHPALVCAIDRRINVTLKSRNDNRLCIHSNIGELDVSMDNLEIQKPFEFVTASVLLFKDNIKSGLDIFVESEFSHQVGLGSSAAVTVATVAVLRKAIDLPLDLQAVYNDARQVVHEVQGCGSGADIAASVYGSIVSYKIDESVVECFDNDLPIGLFYSGSKTPTPEVIRFVDARFEGKIEAQAKIYHQIAECVKLAKLALNQNDLGKLADAFSQQQIQMAKLGVNNAALKQLIDRLSLSKAIKAVKISGSGLGDCVIALGDCSFALGDPAYIPVKVSTKGVSAS